MAYIYPFERHILRQRIIERFTNEFGEDTIDFESRTERVFTPLEIKIREICRPQKVKTPGPAFLRDFFSDVKNLNDEYVQALYLFATGGNRPEVDDEQEREWKSNWARIIHDGVRVPDLERINKDLEEKADEQERLVQELNEKTNSLLQENKEQLHGLQGKEQEIDRLVAQMKMGWIAAAACMLLAVGVFLYKTESTSSAISPDYQMQQLIAEQNTDYGKFIGQTGIYFRMRDSSETLWPHLKVRFYELKDKSIEKVWAVEAEGLYRDLANGAKDPAMPDTTIRHKGIVTEVGSGFYQMILRPVDPEKFSNYGYWFSTFKKLGSLSVICKERKDAIGIGSGISNYQEDSGELNKISSYVFQTSNDSIIFGSKSQMDTVLNFMLKNVKSDNSSKTGGLRISFEKKQE